MGIPLTLQLPRNAKRILAMREAGVTLANGVAVSYVGRTNLMAPHVYCDSGMRYDWEFLRGEQTYLLVRKGLDLADAFRGLFDVAEILRRGYPILLDVEREHMAYIVSPYKLMHVKQGSSLWKSAFPLRILKPQEMAA